MAVWESIVLGCMQVYTSVRQETTHHFQQAICEHGVPQFACLFFWKGSSLSAFFSCKMFHKRSKDHLQPNVPPAKRLRSNLADLFLTNNVSAHRTEEIFEDANLAGAAFCSDIGHPDSVAADPEKKKRNKNAHRDLLRKFLKGTEWPPLYWTKITTFDPKTESLVQSKVPLLLPHEIFGVFAANNPAQLWTDRKNLSEATLQHLLKMEETFGVRNAAACGLWSDSTPMNYDRTESLEVLTLALPGFSGPNSQIRIPLVAFGKKFLAKHITLSQIMDVVAWSFQMLLNAKYPIKGYGGEILDDPYRRRRAGKDLGGVAFLCEFKGDWCMFKDCFCFPGWRERAGICWKCLATPSTMKEHGKNASRRAGALSHFDVMCRILDKGLPINGFFQLLVLQRIAVIWTGYMQ